MRTAKSEAAIQHSGQVGKVLSLVALVPHDRSLLPTGDNSALPQVVRVALPSLLVVVVVQGEQEAQ